MLLQFFHGFDVSKIKHLRMCDLEEMVEHQRGGPRIWGGFAEEGWGRQGGVVGWGLPSALAAGEAGNAAWEVGGAGGDWLGFTGEAGQVGCRHWQAQEKPCR